jgi:hypothetical protein
MRRLSWIVVIGLLQGSSDTSAVAAVTRLIHEDVKASLAGDLDFVRKNYLDSYSEGTSLGAWMTKQDFLDPSQNSVSSRNLSDLHVAIFGSTAIARFRESYDALVQGIRRTRTIICTQTLIRRGSAWKFLATHCSLPPEPTP